MDIWYMVSQETGAVRGGPLYPNGRTVMEHIGVWTTGALADDGS